MSITFHPMQGPITHYLVECLHCRAATPIADLLDAEALALAVTYGHATIPGCLNTSSCARSTLITAATDDGDLPHLTVPTLEARALLDHLGYSDDERCGEVDPATSPDASSPPSRSPPPRSAPPAAP